MGGCGGVPDDPPGPPLTHLGGWGEDPADPPEVKWVAGRGIYWCDVLLPRSPLHRQSPELIQTEEPSL
jgi:hypothetical protein